MSMAVLETMSIWSSIKSQRMKQEPSIQKQAEPYVDPWLKRNSLNNLSPKSLEICTETLCSETGSDDFFDSDFFSSSSLPRQSEIWSSKKAVKCTAVSAPKRSFPPPLSSLSRQNGSTGMQMRTHRIEGRLIVQAIAVPEQNCLQAERRNGRLLLTFRHCTSSVSSQADIESGAENEIISTKKTEEEEEKEVEVEVSAHPQNNNSFSSVKLNRSSTVINKFVTCNSSNSDKENQQVCSNITTAASFLTAMPAGDGGCFGSDEKPLFSSKRKNGEELLHDMRKCSELRKPLFIWEPGCIATSF